ncbi:N-acetylmuramoyl-L-alanine amidase [Bacillus sp. JCM 19041]|uniref:N-acetylmuramoyl-L-alanine amidase n=1 Tax=Bacillus sp. JCM 19041 TaxID=1460637 RepID=UPI0006D25EF6
MSPDSNADVIGKLTYGAKVEYIQVNTDWAQVTYNGKLGFIHTSYLSNETIPTSQSGSEVDLISTSSENMRVVLDAGHGGHDPGAVVQAVKEKDIVYDYKEQIKRVLEADGIEVIETRSNDEFLSLAERVSYANRNNADLFLSIHANSYSDERVNGLETHFYSSRREAQILNDELSEFSSNSNRGIYQSNLQVLRNASVPAVLVELGYMTNANELYLLQSKKHQAEVGEAVRRAVRQI